MTHFLPYTSQRGWQVLHTPQHPERRMGEAPHPGQKVSFHLSPGNSCRYPCRETTPHSCALPASEKHVLHRVSPTQPRLGEQAGLELANPPWMEGITSHPASNYFFQREKRLMTRLQDHQRSPSQPRADPSQLHPLLASATMSHRRPREATNTSDLRCKELWTARARPGQKASAAALQCRGEAMPSAVGSRGRTGGGAEVVLAWNPTVKSSHKVQQLLFFSPLACSSFYIPK